MGGVESHRFGLGPGLLLALAQRSLGQLRVGSARRRGHGDEALHRLVVKIDAARPRTRREGSLFIFTEGYSSDSKGLQHDKLEREWRSFQKEMWNPFVDRVDADLETLNGRSNCHRQLLDDNLKWQRKAEELASRHEQRISELEKDLEEKEVYISNIECMLADLSGRVSEMEGKLCQCREEDVEVAEVEDDDDPTSELSYETVYHTPVAIAGLLEDVPN